MAHKYASIEDNGIALGRLPLSTISEHDSESLVTRDEANGQMDEGNGDGESDLDGLLRKRDEFQGKGRRRRGRIWIACLLFLGVMVFSLLFSLLFLVLARKYVPDYFGPTTGGNATSGEMEKSWLGWGEIRYMFVLYQIPHPPQISSQRAKSQYPTPQSHLF